MTKCSRCGGVYRKQEAARTIRYPRHKATVNVESYVCVGCGDEFVTTEQMEVAYRRAAAQIRDSKGLLSAEDISAIARQYNVSLGLLGRLIGLKPEVVSRWSVGVAIQGRLADKFLRVVRQVPGVMEFLAADLDMPAQRRTEAPAPHWESGGPSRRIDTTTPLRSAMGAEPERVPVGQAS
jgi:putative zinc finger/helix-turn-helix YgiT family protein